MRHGKRGGLLRKREREFPDQDDGRVNENRERPVLKFTGEIAADPGVWTEQRQWPSDQLRATSAKTGRIEIS